MTAPSSTAAPYRRSTSEHDREDEVELGLHGDRPERAVRARRAEQVLHEQAVHHHRLGGRRALARLRHHGPGDHQAQRERRPVRRQDAPRPPPEKPAHPAQPPFRAGGRDRERKTGQHDENDDREVPVEQPAGPPRTGVRGVAGKGQQPAVVEHHEKRGEAANTVKPREPGASGGRPATAVPAAGAAGLIRSPQAIGIPRRDAGISAPHVAWCGTSGIADAARLGEAARGRAFRHIARPPIHCRARRAGTSPAMLQ